MGWVRGEGGRRKGETYWRTRRWKERCLWNKRRGMKGKQVEIADFTFLPFWGEINCDYQISYNRCVVNHHTWEEQWHIPHCGPTAFCMPFFFWGLLMNDLKSDLFLSLCCLGGTQLRGGGVWVGWEDPCVVCFCSPRHTSSRNCIFIKCKAFFLLFKWNSLKLRVGNKANAHGRLRFSALWWLCEL